MAAVPRTTAPVKDEPAPAPAPPALRVGRGRLTVADLERAIACYRDVPGLDVVRRAPSGRLAFLSAGGYHQHIGLNALDRRGGTPPAPRHTGLDHVACAAPDRQAPARASRRAVARGVASGSASDRGVSEALYVADPDGNGVEISWDCPPERRDSTEDGVLTVATSVPFDPADLLAERDAP